MSDNKVFDIKEFNDFFKSGKPINPIYINVPKGIKFISDWPGFNYPKGHLIMDKTICGCGFTEYCLTSLNIPTIVASPRRILLENKFQQHYGTDYPIYYFKNEAESGVLYDILKDDIRNNEINKISNETNDKVDFILNLKRGLIDYLTDSDMWGLSKSPKIIVTYDSLHYVLDVIKELNIIDQFSLVIDEFQSIFTDASFKPDTEFEVIDCINYFNIPNVMYLSATPLMERYISLVPQFNTLPFYKLIWPDEMVEKISIDRRFTKSINLSIINHIEDYRKGVFDYRYNPTTHEIVESKEIVFYVNSVKKICEIISKANMNPNEVNIICSKSSINTKKLRDLSKKSKQKNSGWLSKTDPDFEYGIIPVNPEENKMFTFCTRTAYLGADFYSYCAQTIICSDINLVTLNVDISLDLPQIVGRQRLKDNLFKNRVILYYQPPTNKKKEVNLTNFLDDENKRMTKTNDLLGIYYNLLGDGTTKSESLASTINESHASEGIPNYLTVRKSTENNNKEKVEFNHFLRVSVMRSYEISQPEYQEQVLIKREYDVPDNISFIHEPLNHTKDDLIRNFRSSYESSGDFTIRMKLICDTILEGNLKLNDIKYYIDSLYIDSILLIGPVKLKALEYRKGNVLNFINEFKQNDPIRNEIYNTFEIGKRYSSKFIKTNLVSIYDKFNIKNKKPVATDLKEYYDVKEIYVTIDGKQQKGLILLNRKDSKYDIRNNGT